MKKLVLVFCLLFYFPSFILASDNESNEEIIDLVVLDNINFFLRPAFRENNVGEEIDANEERYIFNDLIMGKNVTLYVGKKSLITANNLLIGETSRILTLGHDIDIVARVYDGADFGTIVQSKSEAFKKDASSAKKSEEIRPLLGAIDARYQSGVHDGVCGAMGAKGSDGRISSRWNVPDYPPPSKEQYLQAQVRMNGRPLQPHEIASAGYKLTEDNKKAAMPAGRCSNDARNADDGGEGGKGYLGGDGKSAGNINLDVYKFSGGAFVAVGGSGGSGGKGGDGGRGGPNDTEIPFAINENHFTDSGKETLVDGDRIRAYYNANKYTWLPGFGGEGGIGGAGGEGGSGGKIFIRARIVDADVSAAFKNKDENKKVPFLVFYNGGRGGLQGDVGDFGELGDMGWLNTEWGANKRSVLNDLNNSYKSKHSTNSNKLVRASAGSDGEFEYSIDSEFPWPLIQ